MRFAAFATRLLGWFCADQPDWRQRTSLYYSTSGLDRSRAKTNTFYLFGIMQGESHPFPASPRSKFNPLQQAAYVGVMYGLLPLLLISGLLSLYPTVVGDLFRCALLVASGALCAGNCQSVFHFWASLSLHYGPHAGRNLQVYGGWLPPALSDDDYTK